MVGEAQVALDTLGNTGFRQCHTPGLSPKHQGPLERPKSKYPKPHRMEDITKPSELQLDKKKVTRQLAESSFI